MRTNSGMPRLGLLMRTPRRRRACGRSGDAFPASPASAASAASSTWSGWRNLRKISDTLIDYALNEPYKADSVLQDQGAIWPGAEAIYRRHSELAADATVRKLPPEVATPPTPLTATAQWGSKTVGHARGRSSEVSFCYLTSNLPPPSLPLLSPSSISLDLLLDVRLNQAKVNQPTNDQTPIILIIMIMNE